MKTSNCEAERRWKNQSNHCTNTGNSKYNHLEFPKEETTGVLSNTPRTGRSRKTSAVDDRNIVTAVKKDPKTTVSDMSNNLQRAGVKVSQSTVRRRLHEQKYRSYTRRCKPLISKKNRRRASKILGQGFMDWFEDNDFMDQSDGKAKVWRKKDLLMIPNIQAHLKHSVHRCTL